jgi:uncharacterized repeat protein (TIGR03843 family)
MIENMHSDERIHHYLLSGDLNIAGRFLWGSNNTYLGEVSKNDTMVPVVYKPSRGERPLWDFPAGTLATREVAAYLTSRELGWNLVPPTVLRMDGPAGPGSLQLYVDANSDHHYFSFSEDEKQRLKSVAIFDLVINNADRKGGHIIIDRDDHLWAIDHGVSFHVEDKLRTVIWDFADEPIPRSLLADLDAFKQRLQTEVALKDEYLELLSSAELDALGARIERILTDPVFPQPKSNWSYPWPLV